MQYIWIALFKDIEHNPAKLLKQKNSAAPDLPRMIYVIQPIEKKKYSINYESELNPEQLRVVMTDTGALLVIAGAGSGKTRAITYRVARLIEGGISPDRVSL